MLTYQSMISLLAIMSILIILCLRIGYFMINHLSPINRLCDDFS